MNYLRVCCWIRSGSIQYWRSLRDHRFVEKLMGVDTCFHIVLCCVHWAPWQLRGSWEFLCLGLTTHMFTSNLTLVWTPCLMHRCVCIWQYILQNYNYKLHFQTSLYTTFRMYPSGPWPLKILIFALLVTREIATYSWPCE